MGESVLEPVPESLLESDLEVLRPLLAGVWVRRGILRETIILLFTSKIFLWTADVRVSEKMLFHFSYANVTIVTSRVGKQTTYHLT